MMECTHYGERVLVQTLEHRFEQDLKKANIDYIVLPLLDHEVYKYNVDGKTRYALVVSCGNFEQDCWEIYIVANIPDDLDWDKLVADCKEQQRGHKPMKLSTRAKILYDKALEMAYEAGNPGDPMDYFMYEPTKEEINLALITLGSSIKKLLAEDHYDVPMLDEI